ncbi:vacuolar protein sorting-associated protein 13a-like [Plakobranchus ocellatus]|uniref:Vacuolar protein sorting-associated protein 13a-like n=1 Tax=Plakobranchus ocellatus TaxID=259542 RepID=A0AAV3YFV0_9GAST|nr:vacuolar protein sorting-associated protein 13a-like [Plakobranchus ocellatus]
MKVSVLVIVEIPVQQASLISVSMKVSVLVSVEIPVQQVSLMSVSVKASVLDSVSITDSQAPWIKIKAPLIIVPQSSKITEAILINLGDISVTSSHEQIQGAGVQSSGKANIVENMVVELTNVRVSRAQLGHGEAIDWEVTIIDPMTFKVNLSRNLSTGWFHGIPDVEVSGVFNSIYIRINQEDIKLFALLSVDNLEEPDPVHPGYKPSFSKESAQSEPKSVDAIDSSHSSFVTEIQQSGTLSPVSEEHELYSNLKVDFKLVSVNIELHRGPTAQTKGLVKRDPTKKLTSLAIRLLKVDLNMLSNSAIKACVSLQDFTLDDCRSEKQGGITKVSQANKHCLPPVARMISQAFFNKEASPSGNAGASSEHDASPRPHIVFLDFDQNSTQDKVLVANISIILIYLVVCLTPHPSLVVANISSIHVCVCMEFLMKVADFFMKALPPTQPKTIGEATQAQVEHDKKAEVKSLSVPGGERKESSGAAGAAASTGSLDFTLKLGKPEIFLVEDQMNPHTDSLIVDVEVDFRMRMYPDTLSINGNIRHLSLVSCVFGKLDTKQAVSEQVILASQ